MKNRKIYLQYKLNFLAFIEPLSREARYWLGFLLADGCIIDNYILGFCLGIKDSDHLRKFARFIGAPEKFVREYPNYRCVNFAVVGKELITQLAKFNIVPLKSTREIVAEILKLDPDFWRGMIDGDGFVRINKKGYPFIGLCGSYQVVNKFADYLEITIGFRPKVSPRGKIFATAIGSSRARKAISIIYYDNCVPVLDRKMAEATKCKASQVSEMVEGHHSIEAGRKLSESHKKVKCHRLHPFDEVNLYVSPHSGKRACWTCYYLNRPKLKIPEKFKKYLTATDVIKLQKN